MSDPTASRHGLHSGFLASVERFPSRPALEAAGQTLTYAQLGEQARALAAGIQATETGEVPLVGVLAHRTPTAFAGILGALLAGHGYVPLNPTFPPERTRLMIERSGVRIVVCDAVGASQLEEVLAGCPAGMVVLAPDHPGPRVLGGQLPGHRILGGEDLPATDTWREPALESGALAYVMFTSGSTGLPKGVMVGHAGACHYVERMSERYGLNEEDRCSQIFEHTFDVSVFDMFCAWRAGACLCCPDRRTQIKPGRWIDEAGLTLWFSAPSTAVLMRRFGQLAPGRYPRLRWSLFAGEALPLELARAWLDAAPNATVENLYGPTEATVVCVLHRFDPRRDPELAEQGAVPIGRPVPGMRALVAGDDLREVAPGEVGELLVTGPQVALGYWRDPERTDAAFVVPPGREGVHYRTGDRVRRPSDAGGPLTYLGRRDHQVKVHGVRVELGEVEAAIRRESGSPAVACVGWPPTATGVEGLEAFVGGEDLDADHLRARLRASLPAPMVPRRVHLMPELPLNPNGKVDRAALLGRLEASG